MVSSTEYVFKHRSDTITVSKGKYTRTTNRNRNSGTIGLHCVHLVIGYISNCNSKTFAGMILLPKSTSSNVLYIRGIFAMYFIIQRWFEIFLLYFVFISK